LKPLFAQITALFLESCGDRRPRQMGTESPELVTIPA